jgi:hypothetical protein
MRWLASWSLYWIGRGLMRGADLFDAAYEAFFAASFSIQRGKRGPWIKPPNDTPPRSPLVPPLSRS